MNEDIIGTQCPECSYIVTKEDLEEYLKNDPENIFKWECPSCGNSEAQQALKRYNELKS